MPALVPLQPPKIFSSRVVSSVPKFTGYKSLCRNLHTKSTKVFLGQYLAFGSIKISFDKNSREVLEERCIDYSQKDVYASAMCINRQIYLDSLLSPTFFTEQFEGTFGIILFYLEKIGVYFACFLCKKLESILLVSCA